MPLSTQPLSELGAVSVDGRGKGAESSQVAPPPPSRERPEWPVYPPEDNYPAGSTVTQQGDVCKYPSVVVLDLGGGWGKVCNGFF